MGIATQITTSRLRMPRLSVAGMRRPNVSLMGSWLMVLSPQVALQGVEDPVAVSLRQRLIEPQPLLGQIDSIPALR